MTPANDKDIQTLKARALKECDKADAAIAVNDYPAFFLATNWAELYLERIYSLKQSRDTPMIEDHPTVDRTGENDADPEVIVTLPCGHTERFWMTGLSDAEYIRRAKAIMTTCPHCGGPCRKDGRTKTSQRYRCKDCGKRHSTSGLKGRPTIGDKPMTSTERSRRCRDRKRKAKED